MAVEPKALFVIDAAKILAKLHLAGQSLVRTSIPVNTGIKNPSATGDPLKPGKTLFDLSNKTGEYQVAMILKISYLQTIDLEHNEEYKAIRKKIDDAKARSSSSSLTSSTSSSNSLLIAAYKEQDDFLSKIHGLDYDKNETDLDKKDQFIKDAVDEYNDKIESDALKSMKLQLEEKTSAALEDMKKYFENFCGKDNASKISKEKLVMLVIDATGKLKDCTEVTNIKDFKFDFTKVNSEIEKLSTQEKSNLDKWISRNVAFIVGYNINSAV